KPKILRTLLILYTNMINVTSPLFILKPLRLWNKKFHCPLMAQKKCSFIYSLFNFFFFGFGDFRFANIVFFGVLMLDFVVIFICFLLDFVISASLQFLSLAI